MKANRKELPSSKLDGILTESSLSCLLHPSAKRADGFRERVNKFYEKNFNRPN